MESPALQPAVTNMQIALLGNRSELLRATAEEVNRLGHQLVEVTDECVIVFPGNIELLSKLFEDLKPSRIVIRSHAIAYGAAPKNPGYMTEDRPSLLPEDAPEQKWLEAELLFAQHAGANGWAAVRLATV